MTAPLYHRTNRVVSHGSPSTLLQETAQTLQSLGPVDRSPHYLIIENYRCVSRYQIFVWYLMRKHCKTKTLTAYAQANSFPCRHPCHCLFSWSLYINILILRITKLSIPIDVHSWYQFLVNTSFCTYSTYVDAQDHICPWNLAIHHRPVEAWPGRGT